MSNNGMPLKSGSFKVAKCCTSRLDHILSCSISLPFFQLLTLNNITTLKSRLQLHWPYIITMAIYIVSFPM